MSQQRLTTDQAAKVLGKKRSTLEKWRRMDRGPAFYRLGGRVFYEPQDLDAYKRACRHEPGYAGRGE